MANLLFASGFEGNVSLRAPSGEWQDIIGTDSATGATWPANLWGGKTSIQMLTGGAGGAISNSIETTTGRDGGPTRALNLDVDSKAGDVTQAPLLLLPGSEPPTDFYISSWVRLPNNFAQILGPGGWAAINPAWKTAGDFRVGTVVEVDGSGTPYWRMKWDTNANGNVPLQTLWDQTNKSVEVPQGEWFRMEFFTHRGNADGRTWLKIDGQMVFDHTGDNIGVNNAPIDRIFLGTSYGSKPYDVWIDDIQIWDGVPTDGGALPSPAPSPSPTPPTSGAPPAPVSITAGTGSDALVLKISQDAYNGDAQYTISVDGKQVGGTLTAKALHALGQADTVTVKGDWTPGSHSVSVNFLNDAFGGSASTDRNLYVDGGTYNGAPVGSAKLALFSAGAQGFQVTDNTAVPGSTNPAPAPVSISVGLGSDALVLKISQDAYNGDAQYTISVDGKQVGGTLTAKALHALGQADTITVMGDWAPGAHSVSVNFLNDAFGGSASTDRNLYVDGGTYNGAPVGSAKLALFSAGAQSFQVTDNTAVPGSTNPTPAPAPSPTSTTINGTLSADTLNGGSGNETIIGRGGNDTINGGGGNDWIEGGRGNEKLTGGAGADTFAFSKGDGWDWISDFTSGTDKLRMIGMTPSEVSWTLQTWSGVGNGLEVVYNNGADGGVFLPNVNSLSASDFVF